MRRKSFAIVLVLLWACIMLFPLTFLAEKTEASNPAVPALVRTKPTRVFVKNPTETPAPTATPAPANTPVPPPAPTGTPVPINDDTACYACHVAGNSNAAKANGLADTMVASPQAPQAVQVSTHGNQGYGSAWEAPFFLGCTQCHESHGNTGNLKMVYQYVRVKSSPVITTGPVVFTAFTGTNSFDDGASANVNRVCVACHVNANNPGYPMITHTGGISHTLVDPDNAQKNYTQLNCLNCHPHYGTNSYNGFMPVAGCIDCHSSAVDQPGVGPTGGRRAIIPEFKNAANGIRSHHVLSTTSPTTAIITDTDCVRCHKGEVTNKHADGYVKLTNVDTGEVYTETTPGAFRPANITLADSKALAPFCLACHDNNGAATKTVSPTIPFSSGNLVPDISGTLPISGVWSASAHATGGSTNTGYGCLGPCHASAHGSNLDNLLAPYTATLQAGNYNEEEGLCYNCHGGAPVARNIKNEFSLSSHHMVSDTEQFKGTVGRGVVECANCHNPHRSTKVQPLINPASRYTLWQDTKPERDFCLTCHVSTAPTLTMGISFTTSYSGTGWYKEKFISSTHDLYLTGPECRACHNSHGSSVGASLIISTFSRADNTTYVDSNFGLCWTCHNATTSRGTNAFGTRHTSFSDHSNTSCLHCHDAHGPYDAGEPMVNFSYAVAKMDATLGARTLSTVYVTTTNGGTCYISCHGKTHSASYTGSKIYTTDCAQCHNTVKGTRRAVTSEFVSPRTHHISPTLSTITGTYVLDCLACHEFSTHQQNTGQRIPLVNAVGLKAPDTQRVMTYTKGTNLYVNALNLELFCQGCHDNNGGLRFTNPLKPFSTAGKPVSVSVHSNINFVPTASYPAPLEAPFKVTCLQCHANHGSTGSNIRIITGTVVLTGPNVTSGTVSFLRRTGTPGSFDDGTSGISTRICVVCHADTRNPGYPMASHTGGVHPAPIGTRTQQDCTTAGCHSHNPDKNSSTADGFTATP